MMKGIHPVTVIPQEVKLTFSKGDDGSLQLPESAQIIAAAQMCLADPDTIRLGGALAQVALDVLRLERRLDHLVANALRYLDEPRAMGIARPQQPRTDYSACATCGGAIAEDSTGQWRHLGAQGGPLMPPHPATPLNPERPTVAPVPDPVKCLHEHQEEHPFERNAGMCADCGTTLWPIQSTLDTELDEQIPDDVTP
jgi:hypothetical protein